MNTVQRLFSNTFLAFTANVVVKASTSLLFILIGRRLGPEASGIFSLGTTYFTFVFGLSALGLHELMVREVAPRRDESGRYLVNYLLLRTGLSLLTYLLLVLLLRLLLPYDAETTRVILILSLAAVPEAVFSMFQALFEAHERLTVPALAAAVNSGVKLIGGFWLLQTTSDVAAVAWMVPLGSTLGLLVFIPGLRRLFRRAPQQAPARLSLPFSLEQLRYTPGFFVIHLFSLLDYQTDVFLISLLLTPADLGYYSAAQTILLGVNLLTVAIRTALYPLMARYYRQEPDKLVLLHRKASQYLIILALPLAAGITLLAQSLISLVFGPAFEPAVLVLQISIWAIVFQYLNVPNARLMLVHNRQREASWLTGLSMAANIGLNLLLIPRYGIAGSALARLGASVVFFLGIHLYVRSRILRSDLLSLLPRPLLATLLMALVVWPLRNLPLPVPVLAGVAVYGLAIYLLGAVPSQDMAYWRQLYRTRT